MCRASPCLRWIANIEVRTRAEYVNREYVNWWLLYMLLITYVPFTAMVVGRYGHFAPAIWLYAGHIFLVAVIGWRLMAITPGREPGDHLRHRQTTAALLIASSLLANTLSLVSPRLALWTLALNFAGPLIKRCSPRQAA